MPTKRYTFDLKLFVSVEIDATSEHRARAALPAVIAAMEVSDACRDGINSELRKAYIAYIGGIDDGDGAELTDIV